MTDSVKSLPVADSAFERCLKEEQLLEFAGGRLSGARLIEVHRHLDSCDLCQVLLSEAAHSLATAATEPLTEDETASWNTTFRAGTLVAQRYLIRRFIARGGMGEVYEAFDTDLQERVALKTVTSTACDNPLAVRRLKAEVQLSRRVSHRNVCRIYDLGMHVMGETGVPIYFLTMEFVDGETLGQRLRLCGALPVAEARSLGRQLLLGLHAAHDANVLHRDFKSDNVMLKVDAEGKPWPVILDFGLARALDRDPLHGRSGSSSAVVGTFSYLAPEQLQGRPHSTASDIYSLGMVWFEMLTGELPFETETSPSPAVAALERLRKRVPAPNSLNPMVPSDLNEVVLGCLRRSPKDRFQTTTEVIAALDTLESVSRPRSRLVYALLMIGGFVCSLVVGIYWPTLRQPRSEHVSVAPTVEVKAVPPVPPGAAPAPTNSSPGPSNSSDLKRDPVKPNPGSHGNRDPTINPTLSPIPRSSGRHLYPVPPPPTYTDPVTPPQDTAIPPVGSALLPAPGIYPDLPPLKSEKPDWENPFKVPTPAHSIEPR